MKNLNSQENLTILLLGTGGTIAGLGGEAYTAAQLPIDSLIPESLDSTHRIVTEQLAQLDSKDMSFEVWERLYARLLAAQNDAAIDAIVITHGTDTMEETAYFLHRTLKCTKPVILTGAMRAADSKESDGPKNLSYAMQQAAKLGSGVWVAFAKKIFSGGNIQKVHPTKLDAFDVVREEAAGKGDVDPHALFALDLSRAVFNSVIFSPPIVRWPRVEIVLSYVGACGALVDALIAQKVDGIVVAGTGNATVHHALQVALQNASDAGIAVRICSRCLQGAALLSPVQTRIDLMLSLLLR